MFEPKYYLLLALLSVLLGYLLPTKHPVGFNVPRKTAVILCALTVLLGGYLRFSRLDFGFPEFYHPDEVTKAGVLRKMAVNNTWNPKYFLHPSLLLYSAKITAKAFKGVGIYRELDKHRYILAGRFVSATAGTTAVVLIFYLVAILTRDAKGENWLAGNFAALALALSPLHLACSRYFKEDALFTTLLLAATLFAMIGLRNRRMLYVAALFSGLCAGSKYTGGLSISLPLLALLLGSEGALVARITSIIVPAIIIGVCGFLGFVTATPYALITPWALLEGVSYEQAHVLRGHSGIAITAWSQYWMYHLSRTVRPGISWLVLGLGVLGIGRALKIRTNQSLLIVAGLAIFYAAAEYVKAKPMPQPERYVLPACIYLIVLGSQFLFAQSKQIVVATSTVVLAFLFYLGVDQTLSVKPDTREKMAAWIKANLRQDAKIVLVGLPHYAPRLHRLGYKVRILSPERDLARHTVPNLKNSPHQYLLITSLSYGRYFSQPYSDQNMVRRFTEFDESFPLVHEESIKSGSYGFHNPTLKLLKIK